MEEKSWQWLACEERTSTLHHEEEYSSNCCQKITRQVMDEHMCGLLQYSLYGARDAAQNCEEELPPTLSHLKLTRGVACPCAWQGCVKGEFFVSTVHGYDITIGGERSAVELFIKIRTTRRLGES